MCNLTLNAETRFLRGECNDDSTVDLSDAVCILDWLFLGEAEKRPCSTRPVYRGSAPTALSPRRFVAISAGWGKIKSRHSEASRRMGSSLATTPFRTSAS